MWHVCPREYYSAVKKEGFASVIVRWRNLKPVTQCEVTQKEKDKRGILMHKYGIQKNSTEEPVYREGVEMHVENRPVDAQGKERHAENAALTCLHDPV